jgi:hypothetical protein
MGHTSKRLTLGLSMVLASLIPAPAIPAASLFNGKPAVSLFRTPGGGIQPQAVRDQRGAVHLLYFKGEPGNGDLYYSKLLPGKKDFSAPLRVNTQRGSAIAIGTIRGGQLAVGKGGRVHVAWNGSDKARPKRPRNGSPMLYARLNDSGTAFEPERNLMKRGFYLDGGGTLAADTKGNIFVAWHAADESSKDESGRKLWVAVSRDNGRTFSAEAPAEPDPAGACACCSVRALADRSGRVSLLYRSAKQNVHRNMILLSSQDHGRTFASRDIHPWEVNVCPMSSEALAEGPAGVFGAWETEGKVYFAKVDPKSLRTSPPVAAPWRGKVQKHPTLAINARGEVLLAWTEGTGWQRGGDLAWQVYDRNGKPLAENGLEKGAIPVWGLASAFVQPGGQWGLFH